MTPEEMEAIKAQIKIKKAEHGEKHIEENQKLVDAKKEVDALIKKAKAMKRKP